MGNNILKYCRNISFGEIKIENNLNDLYEILNNHLLNLCKDLPDTVQSLATFFLFNYAGHKFGNKFDFFKNFYQPTWSIIYHISNSKNSSCHLTNEEFKLALNTQAMSMFLHSLDDHLNDNEIETSHLLLLIRSKAFSRMFDSIEKFSDNSEKHKKTIKLFLNNYYDVMCNPPNTKTYKDYCLKFHNEISTWYIAPQLTSLKLYNDNNFSKNMLGAFKSFGVAWRLIDDLNDFEEDIKTGIKSAIYYLLDKPHRQIWEEVSVQTNNSDSLLDKITIYIKNKNIIDRITKDICKELDKASKYADKAYMPDLSKEYQQLKKPIEPYYMNYLKDRE